MDNLSEVRSREGSTGTAESVGLSIDAAIKEANLKTDEIENKVLMSLKELEEDNEEEDDLRSIDFSAIANHFETLDQELKVLGLGLLNCWTAKCAQSLKPNDERIKMYSSQEILVPVYSGYSDIGDDNKLSLDTSSQVVKPLVRLTRSLNDISMIDKSVSISINNPEVRLKSKSQCSPRKALDPSENTYLDDAVSSHLDLANRPLKSFNDSEVDSCSVKCDYETMLLLKSFSERLSKIKDDAEQDRLCKTIPKVDDVVVTKSKRHISKGTQARIPEKSAFTAYVEMKRELSKSSNTRAERTIKLNKLVKYRFLKNVSMAEYMNCQSRKDKSKTLLEIANAANIRGGALNSATEIQSSKERNVQHTGVNANTPSHIYPDLESVPSAHFNQMKQLIESGRSTTAIKPRVVWNPSFICPVSLPRIGVDYKIPNTKFSNGVSTTTTTTPSLQRPSSIHLSANSFGFASTGATVTSDSKVTLDHDATLDSVLRVAKSLLEQQPYTRDKKHLDIEDNNNISSNMARRYFSDIVVKSNIRKEHHSKHYANIKYGLKPLELPLPPMRNSAASRKKIERYAQRSIAISIPDILIA